MDCLMAVEDVAAPLQMPSRFVEQQIRGAFLDVVKIGNEVRIEPSAYQRYIENREALTPLVGQQRLKAVE